ncbi:hypothetical protein Tco_0001740 [Tanacetum coccineum]
MMSVHISSGLVLHQMTSDHNRSELGIQDHSNEQTRVGITIPPSYSNAEDNSHKVVRLGINPMIQPEPEDLPKDNPKLEIAVLRMKKKCMDKGSKERSPPHNLRQKPGQYICCQNHKLIADIENDIMDPVMQCTTLPNHSGFSQQKLVSFVTEIHTLSIDISLRDCEDYKIAREINRVALELNNVVTEKDRFLEELDSLGVRPVPAKTAEFMREIQAKDKETVENLRILQREMELNGHKKELFIKKLKGVVPY